MHVAGPRAASDEPATHASRTRGAGSPRPAATARARRCAGGPRRRRRSRSARPRPSAARRRRAGSAVTQLVAVAERAARPARAARATACSRRTARRPRAARRAPSHAGGACVSLTVPRQSTVVPADLAARPCRRARATPPRSAPSAIGSKLELEAALELRARQPSPAGLDLAAPRRATSARLPSNSSVTPARAVPCSSRAGSKNAIASAGVAHRSSRGGSVAVLGGGALDVVVGRGARRATGRTATRDHAAADRLLTISAGRAPRVGGRSSRRPNTSVMKPGRDQEGAAEDHEHAVHAPRGAASGPAQRLVEAAPDGPSLRAQQHAPSSESASRSRIVGTTPIASPTLRITYSSASGTTMKSAGSASEHGAARRATNLGWPMPPWTRSRRRPDQRHRPRARARLRRARPGLRGRGRGRRRLRHLHAHLARLPDRPPGVASRWRSSSASSTGCREGLPEDGLHAALDAGPDERRREVRARLLT